MISVRRVVSMAKLSRRRIQLAMNSSNSRLTRPRISGEMLRYEPRLAAAWRAGNDDHAGAINRQNLSWTREPYRAGDPVESDGLPHQESPTPAVASRLRKPAPQPARHPVVGIRPFPPDCLN